MLAALLTGLFACLPARADTFFVAGSGNDTVERFDSAGTSLGPFPSTHLVTPTAMALDGAGNLYVTDDQPTSSIEKYAADGTDLGTFASTNLVRTYGLAFDSAGNLYAADFGNSTIEKFSPTGADLGAFISQGLSSPVGLAFDSAGNLYVANYAANTVGKFSSTGASLGTFASTGLSVPYALAFDSAGNLYVSNEGTNTVRKFSAAGVDLGDFVVAGTLNGPTGIVFDASGNLYVANENSQSVTEYDASGTYLKVFATAAANSAPASIVRLGGTAVTGGTLAFATDGYTVAENAGSVTLTVARTGGTGAVSVNYAERDRTAVAGVDYQAQSGVLSWADGDITDKTIVIPITDRHLSGQRVSFAVILTGPSGGATLGTPASVAVAILDNETPAIVITAPPTDVTVVAGAPLYLSANIVNVTDSTDRLRFLVNGAVFGTSAYKPTFVLNTAAPPVAGTYVLEADLTTSAGQTITKSTRTVTVIDPATDPNAPASQIVTDLNERKVGAGDTITITDLAVSPDGTPVKEVDFYANGVLFASFDSAGNALPLANPLPGSGAWHRAASPEVVPNGSVFRASYLVPDTAGSPVNLVAVALSELLTSQTSNTVTVIPVSRSVDLTPKIALAGLTDGQHLTAGQTYTISTVVTPQSASTVAASPAGEHRAAADSAALAELAYYLNQAALSTINPGSAPVPDFTFTAPPEGEYILEAVGTDPAGVASVAVPIKLEVAAPAVVTAEARGDGLAMAGGENGKVRITRTGDLSNDLTVYYKTRGKAVSGVDYEALPGSAVIPAGATSVKVKIKSLADPAQTAPVIARVKLLDAPDGSYTLGSSIKGKITILPGN